MSGTLLLKSSWTLQYIAIRISPLTETHAQYSPTICAGSCLSTSAATCHLSPGSPASQLFSWTTLPCLDSKAHKINIREQVWMEESLQTILSDRKNICSGTQEGLFYIVNIPALYIWKLVKSKCYFFFFDGG